VNDIATRSAGKFGAILKPKPVELRWLEDVLLNPLGKAPAAVDHTYGRSEYGMLGNDTEGDCAVAGAVHVRMVDADMTHETEVWPTAEQTIAAYLAYTGGHDVGAVLADLLTYWHTRGLLNNKIAAFAPVRVENLAEVKSAINLFGALYMGIRVPANAIAQFNAGQPWDLTGTAADNEFVGGHCVVAAKYTARLGEAITWGKLQPFTWRWFAHNCSEGWVLITHEFLAAHPGLVNLPLLQADIKKLAG
jgi:hypothetical protein